VKQGMVALNTGIYLRSREIYYSQSAPPSYLHAVGQASTPKHAGGCRQGESGQFVNATLGAPPFPEEPCGSSYSGQVADQKTLRRRQLARQAAAVLLMWRSMKFRGVSLVF